MPIQAYDSGVDKSVTAINAYDSGTDKSVQEIIVHDAGVDKTAFASASAPSDSFETFSGGLPEGWSLTAGQTSAVTQESGYSSDGLFSCGMDSIANYEDVWIEKQFDFDGVDNIYVDFKIDASELGGWNITMRIVGVTYAYDEYPGPNAGLTSTLSIDTSAINGVQTVRLESNHYYATGSGNLAQSVLWDNLRSS